MATPERKRQSISIELKKKIIDASETDPKKSLAKLAEEFSIGKITLTKSTIQAILKDKDEILKAINDGVDGKRLRLTTGRYADLEKAILMWFRQVRSQNVAVSGSLLKEKAIKLAKELGIEGFKASSGWLDNFKERHSIKFRTKQGEGASVDLEVVENWRQEVLRDKLMKYPADDIFNVDETGLFWRIMPNRTLAFKSEKCMGNKKSKERITILVGANASGTEKLPLFVIGKSAKPRCFKNSKLPVEYAANSKAWMTGAFFEKWLRKWDNQLKRDDRKILLFLDNCTAHPNIKLQNIKLEFLPPNTTAISQPMDQGIIQNLKIHYRKYLLRSRVSAIDTNTECSINLLDSVFLLQRAWKEVTSMTISNCFRKAGFVFENTTELQVEDIEDKELLSLWSMFQSHCEINADCDISDYLSIDNEIATSGELSLEEIAQACSSSKVDEANSDSEEDVIEINERPPITGPAARQAYLQLRRYFEENALCEGLYSAFDQIEDLLIKDQISKLKQPKISDFFTPQ
ncbi:hypothetical protein FO519_009882 [Halicephalobus sp. NKZ332]|nr:hypothetical protein FO519_009882 [Halicephalobus sp. NKZ332]